MLFSGFPFLFSKEARVGGSGKYGRDSSCDSYPHSGRPACFCAGPHSIANHKMAAFTDAMTGLHSPRIHPANISAKKGTNLRTCAAEAFSNGGLWLGSHCFCLENTKSPHPENPGKLLKNYNLAHARHVLKFTPRIHKKYTLVTKI